MKFRLGFAPLWIAAALLAACGTESAPTTPAPGEASPAKPAAEPDPVGQEAPGTFSLSVSGMT